MFSIFQRRDLAAPKVVITSVGKLNCIWKHSKSPTCDNPEFHVVIH